MSKHCCQLCHSVFVVEDDAGLMLDLECKYGEGFVLASSGGRQVIAQCPLCEYLPDEERYPLFACSGVPVPDRGVAPSW